MSVAERAAELSSAKRLQVGCSIVKKKIIFTGYNGTPTGWDNNCENIEWMTDAGSWLNAEEIITKWPFEGVYKDESGEERINRYRLVTKPEVLHAEPNAIAKIAGSTISSKNATMFVTHAPCLDCAKLIYQSRIKKVYYRDTYRDSSGVEFLIKSGVKVERFFNSR